MYKECYCDVLSQCYPVIWMLDPFISNYFTELEIIFIRDILINVYLLYMWHIYISLKYFCLFPWQLNLRDLTVRAYWSFLHYNKQAEFNLRSSDLYAHKLKWILSLVKVVAVNKLACNNPLVIFIVCLSE